MNDIFYQAPSPSIVNIANSEIKKLFQNLFSVDSKDSIYSIVKKITGGIKLEAIPGGIIIEFSHADESYPNTHLTVKYLPKLSLQEANWEVSLTIIDPKKSNAPSYEIDPKMSIKIVNLLYECGNLSNLSLERLELQALSFADDIYQNTFLKIDNFKFENIKINYNTSLRIYSKNGKWFAYEIINNSGRIQVKGLFFNGVKLNKSLTFKINEMKKKYFTQL